MRPVFLSGDALGEGGGSARKRGSAFPCLYSNNCTKDGGKRLQSAHKKTAYLLAKSVAYMVEKYGIDRLGFLTLTFADHVLDAREAQRRFHSLKTHVLDKRYVGWLRVIERQKSGRIHYHVLVVLRDDIRRGVDFDAMRRGDYRTAGRALREEWAFWRSAARRYRFGRTELMPVRSTKEAISRYVGKYISKHMDARLPEDKGVRLVSASRGIMAGTVQFSWHNPRAMLWRAKLGTLARGLGVDGFAGFRKWLGKTWAWRLRDYIMSLNLVAAHGGSYTYATAAMAVADGWDVPEYVRGPVGVSSPLGVSAASSGRLRLERA